MRRYVRNGDDTEVDDDDGECIIYCYPMNHTMSQTTYL